MFEAGEFLGVVAGLFGVEPPAARQGGTQGLGEGRTVAVGVPHQCVEGALELLDARGTGVDDGGEEFHGLGDRPGGRGERCGDGDRRQDFLVGGGGCGGSGGGSEEFHGAGPVERAQQLCPVGEFVAQYGIVGEVRGGQFQGPFLDVGVRVPEGLAELRQQLGGGGRVAGEFPADEYELCADQLLLGAEQDGARHFGEHAGVRW